MESDKMQTLKHQARPQAKNKKRTKKTVLRTGIAAAVKERTGEPLYVRSAYRSAKEQAELMYRNSLTLEEYMDIDLDQMEI